MSISKPIVVISILILLISLACSEKASDPSPYYEPVSYDWGADWSPDGTRITFVRAEWPQRGILGGMFFYNMADSSLTRIQESTYYSFPTYSPDGQWIAFGLNQDIYRIKADGDSLERMTDSYNNLQPNWSPNGKYIAYHHQIGDDRGIHILDLESGQDKLIVPYSEKPVWFPDNEHLAIISYNFQSGPELAVVDTAGNILHRLTDNDAFKTNLDVSPDGSNICFNQAFSGDIGQLWLINSDGTGLKQLTNDGGDYPAFSPDGNRIAYTHTGNNDGSIWIMDTNGENQKRLTSYGQDYNSKK